MELPPIPLQAFNGHKERFKRAKDIDEFLKEEHCRFIRRITRFMNEGKAWFEQEITPEFVEYVKAEQELSIGRRKGTGSMSPRSRSTQKGFWRSVTPA